MTPTREDVIAINLQTAARNLRAYDQMAQDLSRRVLALLAEARALQFSREDLLRTLECTGGQLDILLGSLGTPST